MKQNLWIINSSLVLLFMLSLGIYDMLRLEPPRSIKHKEAAPATIESVKKKDEPDVVPSWEKIFQDDLFGTFVPEKIAAQKKNLVTPIPEPQPTEQLPKPEPKKVDFVPALNVTLRGIIIAADEAKNVAMIADETGKESMYYLGDKIKDAQIIKITHNRLVLLRGNGQQEVYFLRSEEIPSGHKLDEAEEKDPVKRWQHIVKKENDTNFEVDPTQFTQEIETLGHLLERASIIGTVFKEGKATGIQIGKLAENDLAHALGLSDNDLLVSIDGIDLAEQKNRLKAYDAVLAKIVGDTIQLGLKRNNQDMLITYKLALIKQPRKYAKPGIGIAPDPKAQDDALKMNRQQEREQRLREFKNMHPNKEHQQTMMDIRQRLLSNLRNRAYNTRNR